MQSKIWLSSPHMGGSERKYVNEAFDTNWVAPLGPNVNGLEQDIAEFLKGNHGDIVHVAALSAGTAAIHLGLVLHQVKSTQDGLQVLLQSILG